MSLIHSTAQISSMSDIEMSCRETTFSIGAYSKIDSFVKIKPVGGHGDIIIGKKVYINSGCVIYSGNGVQIGDNVAIASNCTLAAVNHEYMNKEQLIIKQGHLPSKGGIIIHDDVWIGANCVILDGSVIEKGCVIGAGSLVRGKCKQYSIYLGNPLKKVGERT